MQTTLRKFKAQQPREDWWAKLTGMLGGLESYGEDTPLPLSLILDINGLDCALWALWICDDNDKFARLLACDYAEHSLHIYEKAYPNDSRPRDAIETARRYANGKETAAELNRAFANVQDILDDQEGLSDVDGGVEAILSVMAAVRTYTGIWVNRNTANAASLAAEQASKALTPNWPIVEPDCRHGRKWQEQRLLELLTQETANDPQR